MQLSNSPGKLVLPFANSGNKNSIPVASQIGITPGAASLADGFPPLTMTPVAAGGVPPSGLDMNGILYEMSAIVRWANAGGGYPYDADFATSDDVAGYPKGARVLRADGSGYWFNTVDNNETDPDSGAAVGWVPDFTSGAATVPMASANVTLTPVQYGKPIVIITGALTSDLNLVFPNIDGNWTLINRTTGNFSITAKTATGVGVQTQGGFVGQLVSDSTDIYAAGSNKNQFYVGARNFIQTPVDGVTSNQAGIEAAVAYAFAIGADIDWAPGTYVSTANIPNFDNVVHTGRGVIKRGVTTYAVQPKGKSTQTNNVYVSLSGDNANDGRTPDLPKATMQAAFDALRNVDGSMLYGTWIVNLAAGTYNDYATLDGVLSRNRIRIIGPDVAGGTPTAIVDGTGLSAASLQGILLVNGVYGYVKDIKFYNWNGGAGVGTGDASTGLLVQYDCNVWADNCHFDTCGTGFFGYRSRIYQSGGVVNGCDEGSKAFGNSTASLGYGVATSYTGNNVAINYRDASTGVVENGAFSANNIGVKCMYGSNTRVSNCAFSGSITSDVYLYAGGSVFFGTGNSHTANKKIIGQFAFDLDNAHQIYWDGNTNRMGFGELKTPGVRFNFRNAITNGNVGSATQFIFEDNSPQMALVGNNSAVNIFGHVCGIPGNSELASWKYVESDNSWRIRLASAETYRFMSTMFRPSVDNAISLGASNLRWSVVYAGTGTINTSDERVKTFVDIDAAEIEVAKELKKLIRKFQFNDAMQEKGTEGARYHFGVGAQSVADVFVKHGLDPSRYALFCYDEWSEQAEEWAEWDTEYNEKGDVTKEAGRELVQPYRAAGNRYGIRYDELLCFILGAM